MKYLMAVLLVLAPIMAQAQDSTSDSLAGEIGLYVQIPHLKGTQSIPRFYPQGYQYLTPRLGVWAFGYGEKNYFSSVAGPYYDVVPGLIELEAAAGFEVNAAKTFGRYAGAVLLGDLDKAGAELYYENGASRESWYQLNALLVLNPTLAIGALGQKGDGLGPQIRVSVPGFPLRVGAMYALTPKEKGNMLFLAQLVWDWKK